MTQTPGQPQAGAETAGVLDPTDEHLDELVSSLTVEEKAQLTSGAGTWHASGMPSIGLEPMLSLDGPNGVRAVAFPRSSSATCTPCGTALGATWDVGLVAEVAARIGAEAHAGRVRFVLAPFLNLIRSPLGGRNFEAFSEDPVLVAQLGRAYVAGMQSQGIAACPKHFVANDSEFKRTTVNCVVDERTLREIYLLPFEEVAAAGAWSMMAAYNRLNGVHCASSPELIGGILRGEWGWDGVLMSDWDATHDTVGDSVAGLDLEMPGPAKLFGPRLARAVRDGRVPAEVLDAMARRILRLAVRTAALALPVARAATPQEAPAHAHPAPIDRPLRLSDDAAAALVRRAAAEACVLLANDGTLPLDAAAIRRVAVLGPNAAAPCIQGGGAARITAPYAVSPLEAVRAALPDAEILHEPGCTRDLLLPPLALLDLRDMDGAPGLTVEFWQGQEPVGAPFARYNTASSDLHLFGDLPDGVAQDDFFVRMSTWLTPALSGPHQIAMRGLGGRRLFVDSQLVADEWEVPLRVDVPTALFEAAEKGGVFELEAGKRVLVAVEVHSTTHNPSLASIACAAPDGRDLMASAVAAASGADVAVVVVGTDETWETEGRDRRSATLPGRQDELVEKVAAVNPRTIVVVNAVGQFDLPWSDRVAAVVYAWLGGQELGSAVADVLLGTAEPGGRLPFTLARHNEDYPAYGTIPGPDLDLVYAEGINVGYRGFEAAGIEPRFAFGHGLGYTTFEYEALELEADGLADGQPVELRVRVHNTGSRAGKEVVQVYVAPLDARIPRPARELKGFAVIRLEPGETGEIALVMEERDLAYWDAEFHRWRVDPGRYEVQVGHSSRDIRLRQVFALA
jgi:beta-glucosidase